MAVVSNGICTFFLYQEEYESEGSNFMFQLSVPNIEDAQITLQNVDGFNIKYEPVKVDRWGKVVYIWGPSGEMWHITELFEK